MKKDEKIGYELQENGTIRRYTIREEHSPSKYVKKTTTFPERKNGVKVSEKMIKSPEE